jgi:hypothetical protein
LGLTRILEIYPDLITKAKQEELTHLETLDRLVEEEARTRFERLVARRIREARIPVMKSLVSFDFKFP